MPVYNATFHEVAAGRLPTLNPRALLVAGPVLSVQIEVPDALASQLQATSQPVPPSVAGLALIDTGATFSAADLETLTNLGVQPAGSANIWGVGGRTTQSQFPAKLSFPGTPLPAIHFSQIIGAPLSGLRIRGFDVPLVALIGRDILSSCVLIYNGPGAAFSLSF